MARHLHLLFHGITRFVDRGRQLEACVLRPPALQRDGVESFHAVLLAESSTVVPMLGRMELHLERVVTPRRPVLVGGEDFLIPPGVFDSEEREVEGSILMPLPDVIATAQYRFDTRPIFLADEQGYGPSLPPALAHILTYNGVESAQLCRSGWRMWAMPGTGLAGMQIEPLIGPVFPPN